MKTKKVITTVLVTSMLGAGTIISNTPEVEIDSKLGTIYFNELHEYESTKTQLTDKIISDDMLTNKDAYIASDILIYEKGADYTRLKDHVRNKLEGYFSGGNIGLDEFIVAQRMVEELGGLSMTGSVTGETIQQAVLKLLSSNN